jgi:hypothetical protein
MSRTATGAVLVSLLVLLFLGPELGFGPITSTSRADTRPRPVPHANVLVVVPPFVAQPAPTGAPAPGGPPASARPATAVAANDLWARLRACESPTNAGTRYRGYYQFSQSSWQSVGGHGDPAAAPLEEQTARAQLLAARSDPRHQWPVCWARASRA